MLRYFSTYVQQNIVHKRVFFWYSPWPMCVWGPLLFLSANLMICLLTTMTSIMQTWTAMAMIITTIVPESCCGSPILTTTTITLKSEIYNLHCLVVIRHFNKLLQSWFLTTLFCFWRLTFVTLWSTRFQLSMVFLREWHPWFSFFLPSCSSDFRRSLFSIDESH